MEQIRQAVERVKASAAVTAESLGSATVPVQSASLPTAMAPQNVDPSLRPSISPNTNRADASVRAKEVRLSSEHLEAHRIISHNVMDPRSKSFDILRTQVLQAMDQRNWQFVAVTSPTTGCGKTVTAINLALSIARQPERSALLIDMDFQRPQVGRCLGMKCQQGLLGVLEGRTALPDALVQARFGGEYNLMVLPAEASRVNSSELVGSRALRTTLQEIKEKFASRIVIIDMPPTLSSDDVISILPQIDCVLLVAAVGISTLHELKECNKLLQSSEIIRFVLNKASEPTTKYYY